MSQTRDSKPCCVGRSVCPSVHLCLCPPIRDWGFAKTALFKTVLNVVEGGNGTSTAKCLLSKAIYICSHSKLEKIKPSSIFHVLASEFSSPQAYTYLSYYLLWAVTIMKKWFHLLVAQSHHISLSLSLSLSLYVSASPSVFI